MNRALKRNSIRVLGLWGAALLLVGPARSQVAPSAYGPNHSLWVGGAYSNVNASFPYGSAQRLWGMGVFADYNLTGRLGVEGAARFLRFNSFYGESEDNYLAGPRYVFRRMGRLEPYAKFLVGVGRIEYPFAIGSGSYLDLAPGGGVSYRLSRRWAIRVDYEYQFWPGSPGFAGELAHQLTPNGFQMGIAFRPLR